MKGTVSYDHALRVVEASLFQPDILLPAHYLDNIQPKSNLMPEKRLMLAVLEEGRCCFQKYCLDRIITAKPFLKKPRAGLWMMMPFGLSHSGASVIIR